jgi:phage gp46-like protein
MQLTVTPLGDAGVAALPPDIVWNGFAGDFAIATSAEQGGVGGLVAANPLKTAVILLLLSDMRADTADLRYAAGGDRRGWPGDGFDVDTIRGEAPLGSKLWLYRRHDLNDETARQMATEARRALEPLIAQKAVVRIDTRAEADKAGGRILLSVKLYGRDGREAYADRFDLLWRRADGGL